MHSQPSMHKRIAKALYGDSEIEPRHLPRCWWVEPKVINAFLSFLGKCEIRLVCMLEEGLVLMQMWSLVSGILPFVIDRGPLQRQGKPRVFLLLLIHLHDCCFPIYNYHTHANGVLVDLDTWSLSEVMCYILVAPISWVIGSIITLCKILCPNSLRDVSPNLILIVREALPSI